MIDTGGYTAKSYAASSWPTNQWPELFTEDTEINFLMNRLKGMPEDWWPESLLITIKDGEYELGCAILPHHSHEIILNSIKALRKALWQHKEMLNLRKEWKSKQSKEGA